jgi:hypothetical protein
MVVDAVAILLELSLGTGERASGVAADTPDRRSMRRPRTPPPRYV